MTFFYLLQLLTFVALIEPLVGTLVERAPDTDEVEVTTPRTFFNGKGAKQYPVLLGLSAAVDGSQRLQRLLVGCPQGNDMLEWIPGGDTSGWLSVFPRLSDNPDRSSQDFASVPPLDELIEELRDGDERECSGELRDSGNNFIIELPEWTKMGVPGYSIHGRFDGLKEDLLDGVTAGKFTSDWITLGARGDNYDSSWNVVAGTRARDSWRNYYPESRAIFPQLGDTVRQKIQGALAIPGVSLQEFEFRPEHQQEIDDNASLVAKGRYKFVVSNVEVLRAMCEELFPQELQYAEGVASASSSAKKLTKKRKASKAKASKAKASKAIKKRKISRSIR